MDREDDEFAAEAAPLAREQRPAAPRAAACQCSSALALVASSVIAAAASAGIYGTDNQLHGALLYDDKAAVLGSPVVQGEVPLSRVWVRDFWGKDDMTSAESHKSFRPLVTLTYRANHILDNNNPYWYHVVNTALHAAVSALVVPTVYAAFGFSDASAFVPCVAAVLFAVHPVHVESVQNMVGRAELMMSLFYLLGFVVYAYGAVGPAPCRQPGRLPTTVSAMAVVAILVVHLCSLSSLLCKETGVTLPILCAAWDVLVVLRLEPSRLLSHLRRSEGRSTWFWRALPAAVTRYLLLAIGCVLLAIWRKGLNGDSEPDFARKQNMAAFHPHPLFRALSIAWVWMEYFWTAFIPLELSCDWSYPAISTIDDFSDVRLYLVVAYLAAWACGLWAHVVRSVKVRPIMCLAFGICPFFLASNVLVAVGTCKAERVLYLPAIGGCMAIAVLLRHRRTHAPACADHEPPPLLRWVLAAGVAAAYAFQCVRYADTWTTGVGLWEHALRVQEARPSWMRSGPTTHSIGEYGLQLSWANRNQEAQQLLERQIRITDAERKAYLAGGTGLAGGAADEDYIDMGGYGPLALVYRMNGDPFKALAAADKGITLFEQALKMGKGNQKKRDLGLVLAARALALWHVKPEFALPEMRKALSVLDGTDVVVVKLAEQLYKAMEAAGYDPRNGRGPDGSGSAAPIQRDAVSLDQLMRSDPEMARMLEKPRVLEALSAMRQDPANLAKYANDPEVLELARRLPSLLAPGPSPPPTRSRALPSEIPLSIEELTEWAQQGGGGGLSDSPPSISQPAVANSATNPQIDLVPPELGPLPAYATGAAGDPLATPTMTTAPQHQPPPDMLPPQQRALSDKDAKELATGMAAFKRAANIANGGNPADAVTHYCDALFHFAHCSANAAHACLIGTCDTIYLKRKLQEAVGDARGAFCTRQVGLSVVDSIVAHTTSTEALVYARQLRTMLSEVVGGDTRSSSWPPCTEAELTCHREQQLLSFYQPSTPKE